MKIILYRIAQAFSLLQIFSYADTVRNIAMGAFDKIGLAPAMIRMEAVANGFSAMGWSCVFILSCIGHGRMAGHLAYGLAGMMWFDVLTTWPLDMPLPPNFLVWGSAVAAVQIVVGFGLEKNAASLEVQAQGVSA
jgi:hypothetical protein